MKIKKIIKKKLLNSSTGTLMFYRIRVLRERMAVALKDDHTYIKTEYKKRFGKEIDLKNPTTITEKLQWLKLFYRNENMPICSDKYNIRLYLQKYGYEHLLNEVIGVYETPEEIDNLDINTLPKSFVAKATHGSSWNLICKDKSEINWRIQKKIFKQWLKLDLSVFGREWNYREIKPRILIENFIEHQPLIDYKFWCFNGIPKFINVIQEKNGIAYKEFYDLKWNKIDLTRKNYNILNELTSEPKQLDKMVEISKILSKEFPFVRVDFYNFNERLIIGELTFFPAGGLTPFLPNTQENEEKIGQYLKLPAPNHNLELYNRITA